MPTLRFAKPKEPRTSDGKISARTRNEPQRRNGKVREVKLNPMTYVPDPRQAAFGFMRPKFVPVDPARFEAARKPLVKIVMPECRACFAKLISTVPARASKSKNADDRMDGIFKDIRANENSVLFTFILFLNIADVDGRSILFRDGRRFTAQN